eukprot:g2747.t1
MAKRIASNMSADDDRRNYFGAFLRKGTTLVSMNHVHKYERSGGKKIFFNEAEIARAKKKLERRFRSQVMARIFPGRETVVSEEEEKSESSPKVGKSKSESSPKVGKSHTNNAESPRYMRPTKSWNHIHADSLANPHAAPHLKYKDMEGASLHHKKTGRLSQKGSFVNDAAAVAAFETSDEGDIKKKASRRLRLRRTLKKHGITVAQLWHFCGDTNRSDRITLNQLRRGLERASIYLSNVELRKLFVACDVDHDGTIDWREITKALEEPSPKRSPNGRVRDRSAKKKVASASSKASPSYMRPTKRWAQRLNANRGRFGRWTEMEDAPFGNTHVHEHNAHADVTARRSGTGFATWEDSLHEIAGGVKRHDRLAFSAGGADHNLQTSTMARIRSKLRAAAYAGPGGVSLKTLFERFKEKCGGRVSRAAFAHCVRRVVPVDRDDLEQILNTVDADADGFVDYEEFLRFMEYDGEADKGTTDSEKKRRKKKQHAEIIISSALEKLRKSVREDHAGGSTYFGIRPRDVRASLRKAGNGSPTLNLDGILRAFAFLRIEMKPSEARRLAVRVSPDRIDGCVRCKDLLAYVCGTKAASASKAKAARRSESAARAEYASRLNEGSSVPLLDSEVRRLWKTSDDRMQWLRESARFAGSSASSSDGSDSPHFMRATENWTREHAHLVGKFDAPHLKYSQMNGASPRRTGAASKSETTPSHDDVGVPPLPHELKTRRRADHKDWKKVSSPKRGSYWGTYAK